MFHCFCFSCHPLGATTLRSAAIDPLQKSMQSNNASKRLATLHVRSKFVNTEREWLPPGGSLAEFELECKLKPRKCNWRAASPSSRREHKKDNGLPSLPSRAGCWLGPTVLISRRATHARFERALLQRLWRLRAYHPDRVLRVCAARDGEFWLGCSLQFAAYETCKA